LPVQEQKVQQDRQVHQELQEHRVKMERKVHPDHRERQALPASLSASWQKG
jgi:hypothetical protein